MKNPRYSTGPTSPRGRAAAARKKMEEAEKYAPGLSLDMPDEKPVKKMRSGGGMPDLTGDGKVTRADVLKGRGVFKHGGSVHKYAKGGMTRSSASKRADGCAVKGKTRGKFV